MCSWAAVWQAVRGASPVIMTSWWLDSFRMRRAGSLSGFRGQWKTAKPPNSSPLSMSSRLMLRSSVAAVLAGSRLDASAITLSSNKAVYHEEHHVQS